MAKLQIFVLIVALSQAYGAIQLSTLPASLPVNPVLRPESVVVPEVTPPCVSSIRALLEAILSKLPSEEVEVGKPLPAPLPVPVPKPLPVPQPEVEVPEIIPETPCSACFEHINSLLTTAEKVIAIRKMSALMRY